MNDFTTVFEVTDSKFRTDGGDVGIPTLASMLVLGALILFFSLKTNKVKYYSLIPIFYARGIKVLAFLAIVFSFVGISQIATQRVSQHDQLIEEAYKAGRSEIAQGVVNVTYAQRNNVHGADHGDIISIDGKEFVIDFWRKRIGYRESIAFGGALKPGEYARVHYIDDVLLKVEVRNAN